MAPAPWCLLEYIFLSCPGLDLPNHTFLNLQGSDNQLFVLWDPTEEKLHETRWHQYWYFILSEGFLIFISLTAVVQ